jgi:hypothetical protein
MALPPQLTRHQRCQLERLRSSGDLPDDAAFLELAIAHQVAAPLAVWAQRRGAAVPESWARRLAQVRAMNLRIEQQAFWVGQALDAAGIDWLVGKGLLRALDPLLPDRFIGDIDIYLPGDQAQDAIAALAPRYQPDNAPWDAYIEAQMLVPLAANSDYVPVDLHRTWHGFVGGAEGRILAAECSGLRRQNFASPSARDDLRIALYETIYSVWNNPLRRLWELQILVERLAPPELAALLGSMGLRSSALTIARRFIAAPWLRRSRRSAGVLAMLLVSRRPVMRARELAAMRLRAR